MDTPDYSRLPTAFEPIETEHTILADTSPPEQTFLDRRIDPQAGGARIAMVGTVALVAGLAFIGYRNHEDGTGPFESKGTLNTTIKLDKTTYAAYEVDVQTGASIKLTGNVMKVLKYSVPHSTVSGGVRATVPVPIFQQNTRVNLAYSNVTDTVNVDLTDPAALTFEPHIDPARKQQLKYHHGPVVDVMGYYGGILDILKDDNLLSGRVHNLDELVEKISELAAEDYAVEKCGQQAWEIFGKQRFVDKNRAHILEVLKASGVNKPPKAIVVDLPERPVLKGPHHDTLVKIDKEPGVSISKPKAKGGCEISSNLHTIDGEG